MEAYCKSLKLKIDVTKPTQYFVCNNLVNCGYNSLYLLSTLKNKRRRCEDLLAKPVSRESSNVFDGFVNSNGSFMITDDLKVLSNSFDTEFYPLKNSGIESMSLVNEVSVTITKNQVSL